MFHKLSVLEVPRPRRRVPSSKGQIFRWKSVGLKLDRYLLITVCQWSYGKLMLSVVCVYQSVCSWRRGDPCDHNLDILKLVHLGEDPSLSHSDLIHTGCFGPRIHILMVRTVNLFCKVTLCFFKNFGCLFLSDIKNHAYSSYKVTLDYVILLHKSTPCNPGGWCNPHEFGLSTSLYVLGSYHILCIHKAYCGHFSFSYYNWCPSLHCESYHKVQCDLLYKAIILLRFLAVKLW